MTETTTFIEHRSKYRFFKLWALVFAALAFFLLLIGVAPIVAAFIILGILSMYPMRFIDGLGVEMCSFFTVLTSMVFGVIPGILVGKVSNTVGLILAGQLDQNIVYDFGAFLVMAIIASMFPAKYIAVVGIALVGLYHLGYTTYNKMMGTYDGPDMLFTATNILFNIALFWRLGPVLVGLLT